MTRLSFFILCLALFASPLYPAEDYFLDQNTKILTLISKAGGILPGGGKRILLIRNLDKTEANTSGSPSVKPTIIDYFRLVHEGDQSQNIEVQDGDTVNVPKANEI